VAEYFDVGQSRSLPWPRRPEASTLLKALRDPNRGFEAVVIGEPHRAFYGNQFGWRETQGRGARAPLRSGHRVLYGLADQADADHHTSRAAFRRPQDRVHQDGR
jgi:hypothetical protein